MASELEKNITFFKPITIEEVAKIKLEMFCKSVSDQNFQLMICMISVVKFKCKTSLAKEEIGLILAYQYTVFLGNDSCS